MKKHTFLMAVVFATPMFAAVTVLVVSSTVPTKRLDAFDRAVRLAGGPLPVMARAFEAMDATTAPVAAVSLSKTRIARAFAAMPNDPRAAVTALSVSERRVLFQAARGLAVARRNVMLREVDAATSGIELLEEGGGR